MNKKTRSRRFRFSTCTCAHCRGRWMDTRRYFTSCPCCWKFHFITRRERWRK